MREIIQSKEIFKGSSPHSHELATILMVRFIILCQFKLILLGLLFEYQICLFLKNNTFIAQSHIVGSHLCNTAAFKSISERTKEIDHTSVTTMIVIRLLHKLAISRGIRKYISTISHSCARSVSENLPLRQI